MKKFKISLFAVLAIILGLAASSFTTHPNQKAMYSDDWFQYVSGPVDEASSYTISTTGDPGCDDTQQLCGIKVMNDGNGQPDQDALDDLYAHNSNLTQPVLGKVEFRAAP